MSVMTKQKYLAIGVGKERDTMEEALADAIALILGWDGKGDESPLPNFARKLVECRDEVHDLLVQNGMKPKLIHHTTAANDSPMGGV